ncbi:MAG: oligosaccharide flippase family protein [Chthoniobacterales bacterium]
MIEAAPLIEKTDTATEHGAELKRGAITNTVALFASNFRGIFTFLVARLLGPAALGMFSVAWATTDLLTKIGMFALDNSITTFIAHSEAAGDRGRSRGLFRLAVLMAVGQCAALAVVAILVLRLFGPAFGLDPQMNGAVALLICAMPGVALYRISTAVSRGMKVMAHDIYSRGITETVGTTLAFLIALKFGATTFAPQIGAIIGTAASGLLAVSLAASLFRGAHAPPFSMRTDAKRLLTFSAPITAYDLLNALIVRLDVIVLACFIGRAPGVTLPVVGVYGAVVEVAGGLRKVNQIFNPIFAPIVAGMTLDGQQARASVAFARVAQWMLWALLPIAAGMLLAAPLILSIYGPAFRQGSAWLGIVAIACGTNAFVGLAETVIMVQKPHLNLRNSVICCVIAIFGNILLIARFGATGAAFGILLPYLVFGLLRYQTLRQAFGWPNPWQNIHPPIVTAALAGGPAILCRVLISGVAGQMSSSLLFLLIYFAGWRIYRARSGGTIMSTRPPHL